MQQVSLSSRHSTMVGHHITSKPWYHAQCAVLLEQMLFGRCGKAQTLSEQQHCARQGFVFLSLHGKRPSVETVGEIRYVTVLKLGGRQAQKLYALGAKLHTMLLLPSLSQEFSRAESTPVVYNAKRRVVLQGIADIPLAVVLEVILKYPGRSFCDGRPSDSRRH